MSDGDRISVGDVFVQDGVDGKLGGEVLAVDDIAGVTVRRSDGGTFSWPVDGIPRSVRFLPRDSFRYVAVVEPDRVRETWRVDPDRIVVELLRELGRALDAPSLQAQVTALGIDVDRGEWKRLLGRLRRNRHIVAAGRTYRFSSEPVTRPTSKTKSGPETLLEDLTSTKGSVRRAAEDALREHSALGGLTRQQEAAASLLGVTGLPGGWDDLTDPVELPLKAVRALLGPAQEVGAAYFVCSTATKPAAGDTPAEPFLQAMARFEPDVADEGITRLLDEWHRGFHVRGIRTLRRRLALLSQIPSPRTSIARRRIATTFIATLSHQPAGDAAHCIAILTDIAARDTTAAAFGTLLEQQIDATEVASLLASLAKVDERDRPVRVTIADALATTNLRRELLDPRAWAALDLEELALAFDSPDLREVLSDPALESPVTGRVIAVALASRPLDEVLGVVRRHPSLAPRLPADRVLTRIRQSPDDAAAQVLERVLALRDAETETALDRVRAEAASAAAAQVAHRDDQLEAARRQAIELRSEILRLEAEARERIVSARRMEAADLRQAQIDVIRALVDVAEELRSATSAIADPDGVLLGLSSATNQHLERFGVVVRSPVGSVEPFDARFHRVVAGEPADLVQIVTPVYVIEDGSDVTPIRYGNVIARGGDG